MKHLFTEHPASVGETYLEHLHSAWWFAGQMALALVACLVHGLLPFCFKTTGSGRIALLYDRMITNRSKLPRDRQPNEESPAWPMLGTREPDAKT